MKTPMLSRSLFHMLLCGSALLISGQAVAAPQGPELYFYPSGKWSLDKQGQSCSTGAAFNNGFILNFTGGESWVESLNVNFRQDIFTPGQAYAAVLTAPGVQSQTLKATAPDAQSLAINLLGRKELFKAIKTGAVLDLIIEGNEFRFYLTGFSPVAEDFEKCMAGGVLEAQAANPEQQQAYTINEAIAMEETTKAAAAAPVPAPVVQEIPYTETQKIGGEVIDPSSSLETQTEQIGSARLQGDAVPVETTIVANNPVNDTTENAQSLSELTPVSQDPVIENAPAATAPTLKPADQGGRPRMSDQIAQEMLEHPEMAELPPSKVKAAEAMAALEAEQVSQNPLQVAEEPVHPLNTAEPELKTGGLAMPPDLNRAALIPQTEDAKTIDYSALARAQLAGESVPAETAIMANDAGTETTEQVESVENLTPVSDESAAENMPETTTREIVEAPTDKEEVLFDGPRVDVSALSTQPPAMPPVNVNDAQALQTPADEAVSEDTSETVAEAHAPSPAEEEASPSPIMPEAEPELVSEPTPEPITENYKTPEQVETRQSYKADADFRQAGLSSGPDTASMARMAELEDMVNKLKAENMALNKELDTAISASEEERLSISSENWNLEQATMRFNEAERQIKKLGMELQKERAQCEAEKRELEASLFDPQITSQEQMARLGSLEDQLRDAKAQLEAQRIQYEARIKELGGSI